MSPILPRDLQGWGYYHISNTQFILRKQVQTIIFQRANGWTHVWNIQKMQGGRVLAEIDMRLPASYIESLRAKEMLDDRQEAS